jgi:hypothetical protein
LAAARALSLNAVLRLALVALAALLLVRFLQRLQHGHARL